MARKHLVVIIVTLFLMWFPTVRSNDPSTFWSDYPTCEEQCHESVWASQQCSLENSCECDSGQMSACLCLADRCLCVTGSWLIAVAQCIGHQCGSAAVTDAATIVQHACIANGFSLAVSTSELVSVGLAAIPTTTTTTTASSSASSSSSSSSASSLPAQLDCNNCLTEDQKIALGVGLGVGLPSIIIASLAWIFPIQRKRAINCVRQPFTQLKGFALDLKIKASVISHMQDQNHDYKLNQNHI